MLTRFRPLRVALAVQLIMGLLACTPDYSDHIEVLKNISPESKYMLYSSLSELDDDNPLKNGILGDTFYECMSRYSRDWNPGAASGLYYLVVLNSKGQNYYYTVRTLDDDIKSINRWVAKTKYGFKSTDRRLRIDCSINDLG